MIPKLKFHRTSHPLENGTAPHPLLLLMLILVYLTVRQFLQVRNNFPYPVRKRNLNFGVVNSLT
jgi:hypothetical protein